jgi:SAM-dependent methyltransferase
MTLLRLLEYERLREISLHGRILDVGGGEKTDYRRFIKPGNQLETINIDPDRKPTFVADVENKLDVAAGQFDHVISLNTLEHLFDDGTILKEIYRVLRPGGAAHLMVPFIYQIHASPSDYHRHTEFFWERALSAAGFSLKDISVEPLTFGTAATSLSFLEFGLPRFVRTMIRAIVLPPLFIRTNRWGLWGNGSKCPLGYYIAARKLELG